MSGDFSLYEFLKGKKHVFAKPPVNFGGHGIEKIKVKEVRKEIARIKTVLRERELKNN